MDSVVSSLERPLNGAEAIKMGFLSTNGTANKGGE